VRRYVGGVFLATLAFAINEYMLVRWNVSGVFLATLAFAINEYMLVRWYVVRVFLAALALTFNKFMLVRRIIRIGTAIISASHESENKRKNGNQKY